MVIKTWGLVPTSSGIRCVRLELRAEAGIMFRVSGVSHQAMMVAHALIAADGRVPFLGPHPAGGVAGLIGSYRRGHPVPGAWALADRGILFLDELTEWPRNSRESLRHVMETGVLHLHRADGSSAWSSSPWIVAATNPCPCGMGQDRGCVCASQDIRRHRRKLSQPLLDRFPIQLEVLGDDEPCERPWEDVVARVRATRNQRPTLSWDSGAQSRLHACTNT